MMNTQSSASYEPHLLQYLPAGVFIHAPDTRILFANAEAASVAGQPLDQLTGKVANDATWSFVREDNTPMPVDEYPVNRVLATRQTVRDLTLGINRAATNDRIWVLASAFPEFDDQQALQRIVVTFIDITGRKRAEEALQANTEWLRLALDAANAGTWEWDVRTNENRWSEELWQLYGLAPHSCEPSYEAWRQTIHPDDRAAAERVVQEAARTGTELNTEWRIYDPDGAERWVMSRGRPTRDAHGTVVRYHGIVLDITARKHAEQAILASKAKLDAALASMTDAVFISNAEGQFVEFNDAFATFHKFRSKDECATSFAAYPDLLDVFMDTGELAPVDMWAVPRALRGELGTNVEYALRRKDTGEHWVASYSFAPIRDAARAIVGSVVVGRDITARKQAENALRQSEAKFATAFTSSPAALLITRLSDGRYLEMNAAYSAMVGYARDELLGHVTAEFDVYIDAGERQALVDQLLANGSIREFETRLRHRSGAIRHVIADQEVITFNNEVCILSHFLDITERKRLEEALHTASQRFQAMLASLYGGILVLRGDHRVEFANQAFCDLFDLAEGPEDLLNLHASAILQRIAGVYVASPAALARIHEILANGQPVRNEEIAIAGGRTYLRDFIPIVIDGQQYGRVWHHLDITDRVRAEQALRESEEQYRSFVELNPQVPWTADPQGNIIDFNARWLTLTGLTREEALGGGWAQAPHPDDRPAMAAAWTHSVRTGATYDIEHRIRLADGTYRWMRSRADARRDAAGQVVRWYGTTEDIHDRKQAEAALRAAMEREQALRVAAETASRLKDEFLATVSHELRTPLTAFLGYAQLLQRRQRDTAYVASTVEKMVRSAQAQAQLIEDLLDVSRIVSGRLRLELAPLELIPVVRAALDTVRPTLAAKGLQLQLTLDPATGAVLGDANRLQQVVWNLLANAAKFTPPGGTIQVRLAQDGRDAVLTVSDSGQGIRPDFLPFVFERFRQEDSSTQRVHGGLGLGLAIVRHLVELHGGTVQAMSAGVSQGATFTVRLPIFAADTAPARARAALAAEQAFADGPPSLHERRVLVVDDQPAILELLEEILAAGGAIVRSCATAREALEAVRTWRPDVLVSDIAMPGEDGYWLIRHIRALAAEEGGATPAVALTAYVRIEDRLQVLGAGFQLYVPKPVEPGELQDVVARLVRHDGAS
ncbi:MAG: PAS domain S-box protein [Chloroflexales bacterium]|nr:PAS domain S-box protein [Chloroflexales bacterium]